MEPPGGGPPDPRRAALDLADALEQFLPSTLDGSLLWPRYPFVVDEARRLVWFAGVLLDFPRPEVYRLLLALLRRLNKRVTLSELNSLVNPSRKRADEAALRKVKLELVDLLEEAIGGRPHLPMPLSRDSERAGYGLTLPFGSVRWLQTSATSAHLGGDVGVR